MSHLAGGAAAVHACRDPRRAHKPLAKRIGRRAFCTLCTTPSRLSVVSFPGSRKTKNRQRDQGVQLEMEDVIGGSQRCDARPR